MLISKFKQRTFQLWTLWSLYKDGTLKESLEDLFITDEVTEIAGGEQVELIVTIDEQEYNIWGPKRVKHGSTKRWLKNFYQFSLLSNTSC